MRKIFPLSVISFVLSIFLTSYTGKDGFVDVLNVLEDNELREKLILFEMEGIERLPEDSVNLDRAIQTASSYLGTRHRMGGLSRQGIDCSGLVKVAFAEAGLVLPHSSNEQARFGRVIPQMEELKAGDMVFFCNSYATRNPITHSGIYIGNNNFIHASFSAGVVITSLESPYWNERFLFGTRLSD